MTWCLPFLPCCLGGSNPGTFSPSLFITNVVNRHRLWCNGGVVQVVWLGPGTVEGVVHGAQLSFHIRQDLVQNRGLWLYMGLYRGLVTWGWNLSFLCCPSHRLSLRAVLLCVIFCRCWAAWRCCQAISWTSPTLFSRSCTYPGGSFSLCFWSATPNQMSCSWWMSLPIISMLGVKPVLECFPVCYAAVSWGWCSSQLFWLWSTRQRIIWISVWLNHSTCPFEAGWYGVVLVLEIQKSSKCSWKSALSKLQPWSICNSKGGSKVQDKVIDQRLSCWSVIGNASAHLVN